MRFKVIGTVTWSIESDSLENAQELANQEICKLPKGFDLRLLRLDKLKDKIEKIRLGEFSLDEVIPYITEKKVKREYECDGIKHQVNMNSPRYFLFREKLSCVVCGLVGSRMFLEYHPKDKSPHFNLYGEENGQLILMTKDHIHAKSFGGEDLHSNYALMCQNCNSTKGNLNLTLDNVRELRELYTINATKMPKKQLYLMIEEHRRKLSKPWKSYKDFIMERLSKTSADCMVANCDLNVIRENNELIANHIYGDIKNRIGYIKKWTYIEPLLSFGDITLCEISKDLSIKINSRFLSHKSKFLDEFKKEKHGH